MRLQVGLWPFCFPLFFCFWIRKISSATRIAKTRKSACSHRSLELTPKRILENHLEILPPKEEITLPTKCHLFPTFLRFFVLHPSKKTHENPPPVWVWLTRSHPSPRQRGRWRCAACCTARRSAFASPTGEGWRMGKWEKHQRLQESVSVSFFVRFWKK